MDTSREPAAALDAQARLATITDHYRRPRHYGALADADVVMPGGNPGCGDVVVVYVKGRGDVVESISFEGHGCTISQAATSILLQYVHEAGLSKVDQILALDYQTIERLIGPDLVRMRPRCAVLGLATVKGAVEALRRKELRAALAAQNGATPAPEPPPDGK